MHNLAVDNTRHSGRRYSNMDVIHFLKTFNIKPQLWLGIEQGIKIHKLSSSTLLPKDATPGNKTHFRHQPYENKECENLQFSNSSESFNHSTLHSRPGICAFVILFL